MAKPINETVEYVEGFFRGHDEKYLFAYDEPTITNVEDARKYMDMLNRIYTETGQDILDTSADGVERFMAGYFDAWRS